MTETSSSTSASGSTATVPPGMTDELRMLRRSRSDRVVAGVLGGLGRRLGIDPLVLRVTTVVLTVFGGVGILLYAVAWLLIPADDDPASVLDQSIGRREVRDASAVPLALGLGSVIVISSGVVIGASWNGRILLILAAVGLFLLLKRRAEYARPEASVGWDPAHEPSPYAYDPGYAADWPAPAGPDIEPTAASPAEATTGTAESTDATESTDAADTLAAPSPTATPVESLAPEPVPEPPAARPTAGMPPGVPGGWPEGPDWDVYDHGASPYDDLRLDTEPQPEPPVKRSRPRSVLGLLTTCAAFIAVGVLAILEDVLHLDPGALYVAVPLAIVAVGLLVGTWYGRSRWLIFLGILLTLALVPATFVSRWDMSAGPKETEAGPSVADLPTEPIVHGAGPFSYDLSALELDNEDKVSLTLQLGAGEMTVLVPEDADVVVNSSVGLGSTEAFGEGVEGVGRDLRVTDEGPDGPGGGEIELNLEVGVGALQVERAESPGAQEPDRSSQPERAPREGTR